MNTDETDEHGKNRPYKKEKLDADEHGRDG